MYEVNGIKSYLGIIIGVQSKTMVDTGRQDDKIAGLNPDSNPTVGLVPDIKVATSIQTVTNFLISMNVFCVEILQFPFVIGKCLWRYIK